jgi:hypothetical protein
LAIVYVLAFFSIKFKNGILEMHNQIFMELKARADVVDRADVADREDVADLACACCRCGPT